MQKEVYLFVNGGGGNDFQGCRLLEKLSAEMSPLLLFGCLLRQSGQTLPPAVSFSMIWAFWIILAFFFYFQGSNLAGGFKYSFIF